LLEVVDKDRDSGSAKRRFDDRLDLGPRSSGKATADPRHVNRGRQFEGLVAYFQQSLFQRLVADQRAILPRPRAALSQQVGHPEVRLNLHELDGTKSEVIPLTLRGPAAKLLLGLLPALRDRNDETLRPMTCVVADVAEDLIAGGLWAGRIAL